MKRPGPKDWGTVVLVIIQLAILVLAAVAYTHR